MNIVFNRCLAVVCVLFCVVMAGAQVNDAFNGARQKVGGGQGSAFNRSRAGNFNDYRQKLNAEYVSRSRQPWKSFNSFRGIALPDRDRKPVAPISMPDDELNRQRQDRQLEYGSIAVPRKDKGTPQPVAPVEEVPQADPDYIAFTFCGTPLKVRQPQAGMPSVGTLTENQVADALETLCGTAFNNLLIDCIRLRSRLNLCDWAYLRMLQAVADTWCGQQTDVSTLLVAWLYSQSGYRIRMAQRDGQLEMLYASCHDIYNVPYIEVDGEKFFSLSGKEGSIKVNEARFPKEQSLSLWMGTEPQVAFQPTPARTLTARRYPQMSVKVSVNSNLLDLFSSYPPSEVGGNFMTRWAMYANTPICASAREELYGQLRPLLSGLSQLEAVERLLNWVQTAFVYEYDDKVWGRDRAFFPDETLCYPYCDCEDRSILFTRMVRDLLGLRCLLIYYPGHLASAVCFSEEVKGDYLVVGGRKYIVCDPTYIGARAGCTMPDMDNASATVITLD